LSLLVVDDESDIREIVCEILTELFPAIEEAADGQFALERLQADHNKEIKIVISDIRMPRLDGLALLAWIKKHRPDIRIALITGFSEIAESQSAADLGCDLFMPKPFNQEEMISGVQKLLSSADQDLQIESAGEDYGSVQVEDFVSGKSVPFSIFLKTNTGRMIKIAHKGEDLDISRINALKSKGIHELWLTKEDVQAYATLSGRLLKAVIQTSKPLPEERKVRLLKNAGQITFQNLSLTGFDSEALILAQEFVGNAVEIMTRSESVSSVVESFSNQDNSIFAHSVLCASYAGLVGRVMRWSSRKNILSLAIAAFFHDFGLKGEEHALRRISRSLMSKSAFDSYMQHPRRSVELLESLGDVITDDIKSAIRDHHESCQGNGFPQGLSVSKIFPMAKIISVVDDFVEEFLSSLPEARKDQKAILTKVLKTNPGKYDAKSAVALLALATTQNIAAASKFYAQNESRAGDLAHQLCR